MTRRDFSPPTLLLALLVLVACLTWLWLESSAKPQPAPFTEKVENAPPRQAEVKTPASAPVEPAAPVQPEREVVRADGKRELQAYRLAVRGGVVSLDGTQRIAGDFHRRRGPQAWMPGMWCVRLLDADMRVLAEETANAPDEACVVLDPQNLGANGQPQATQFAGAGEESMLQVRLPPHPDAKWLKVYRLSGMERADWNSEPLGSLLTAISLP
ncbi:hypothetical protein [Prosthecobacter sp.]|uniref:hypothetical protein n=1 Tax=Prosthecobacter sp. TaxID=1965333 RepID=UPI002AB8AF55|nr:hypothetical protein [Prosthecobacter sp.]MDZ4404094.1 hypothetical protein [Prosthecobacter sp.]